MDNHSRGRRAEPTRLTPTAIAGQATFAGCLAAITVARQALLPILPRSVTLPPGDSVEYPCLLAFGEQRDGATFFGGLPVPWGIRYHELMVAVPFVSWEGAAGTHLLVSGMTCDFWPAVWNGNLHYGFRKRFAPMQWDGERFTVTGEGHYQPSFEGALQPRASATPGQFAWIQSAAALPVLGHRRDGAFVRSRFDWDFQEAAVEAVALRLTLGRQFRELPLGEHSGCYDDAYRVQGMRWRLSWPTTA